jgi:Nif-specific regulatory protein
MKVGLTLKEATDLFKKEFIELNLRHTAGNRSLASKNMNIQRTYLSRLISRYNLLEM